MFARLVRSSHPNGNKNEFREKKKPQPLEASPAAGIGRGGKGGKRKKRLIEKGVKITR